MAQKRLEFELVDHGIQGSQTFQGCGVAFTKYAHVATGIGESAREAAIDAFEGADVPTNVDASEVIKAIADLPDKAIAHEGCRREWRNRGDGESRMEFEAWHEGCEVWYFVSLRWRVVETADEVRP